MSVHLVCDYCNRKIKERETYYTVHQHNILCGDAIADICCDCAEKKLLVDLDLHPIDNKRLEKIINPLQIQYSEKL